MKLLRALPLLALSFVMVAQTAVLRTLLDRGQVEAPATLCVLDAPGGHALEAGFQSLLQQEDLRAYQVPLRAYVLGSGAERDLLARHHLEQKAQWVLVDRRGGRLLARGEALPTAQAFAQELEQAGFRDRVKELRAYLKQDPRVLEAREQLLTLLRKRSEAAAQRLMGIQLPPRDEGLDKGNLAAYLSAEAAAPPVDLSHVAPLNPTQDLEAWGAFVQELDLAFRGGQWRELEMGWVREARALDAASPSLKGLYQRWQPAVESALQQEPGSEALWELWIWMSQARGGRPLRPLLASLRPSPLSSTSEWPPAKALRVLFETARATEDWRALRDHFQSRWTGEPHTLRDAPPLELGHGPDASRSAMMEQDWTLCLEPLLESCLRGGDRQQADLLLIETLDASRWTALAAKASAVAARCGLPDLARRWASLRPGGPRR